MKHFTRIDAKSLVAIGIGACLLFSLLGAFREDSHQAQRIEPVPTSTALLPSSAGFSSSASSNATISRCLATLSQDLSGKNREELLAPMRRMLLESQWTESRGITVSDPRYGGIGADWGAQPDLYHTALAVEALVTADLPSTSDPVQRALKYVMRCQHLSQPTEGVHQQGLVAGGFAMTPYMSQSNAPKVATQKSLGILTCVGLKAYLAAGIPQKDRRVQAAVQWLAAHYSLSANPGSEVPRRGLFEYYLEFATAMSALQIEQLKDAKGIEHNWGKEFTEALVSQQNEDGSWHNAEESLNPEEASPSMTTGYAVLTLQQILDFQDQLDGQN